MRYLQEKEELGLKYLTVKIVHLNAAQLIAEMTNIC